MVIRIKVDGKASILVNMWPNFAGVSSSRRLDTQVRDSTQIHTSESAMNYVLCAYFSPEWNDTSFL